MQWLLLIFVLPYFLLLLSIYLNLGKIRPFNPEGHGTSFISVIVPCRNETLNIVSLLEDISRQDYPADLFEVIVVDDNSTDGTFDLASAFRGIKNLRVLGSRGHGKKTAISTGVDLARGELIVTTDADCSMGKSWISTVASFYSQEKADLIIGPVILEDGPGLFRKFQELEFLSLQGVTAGTAQGGNGTMCNGANLAFRKETFLRHSGNLHVEIPSGDDVFLLHSLKEEKGSKIRWLESMEALVTASATDSFSSFFAQRTRWISKGKAYNDRFTMSLAIVTFVTILAELIVLIFGFFKPEFFPVFAGILVLKSVPDFLILSGTVRRYRKKNLIKWFVPSQLIYPFYVMGVVIKTLRNGVRFNPTR